MGCFGFVGFYLLAVVWCAVLFACNLWVAFGACVLFGFCRCSGFFCLTVRVLVCADSFVMFWL